MSKKGTSQAYRFRPKAKGPKHTCPEAIKNPTNLALKIQRSFVIRGNHNHTCPHAL